MHKEIGMKQVINEKSDTWKNETKNEVNERAEKMIGKRNAVERNKEDEKMHKNIKSNTV